MHTTKHASTSAYISGTSDTIRMQSMHLVLACRAGMPLRVRTHEWAGGGLRMHPSNPPPPGYGPVDCPFNKDLCYVSCTLLPL